MQAVLHDAPGVALTEQPGQVPSATPPRYGAEYQPIVDPDSGTIHGFEALSRFTDRAGRALAPDRVFHALHRDPASLARVELQMKRLQLTHAPVGVPLFVNLDPHAFVHDEGTAAALIELCRAHPGTVIEIIENNSHVEARDAERVLSRLRESGLTAALDDVGAPDSLFSVPLLLGVDYIKFDRNWLERAREARGRALLEHLVGYARAAGQRTILEGIETEADRVLAQALDVDLVQGFLYRPLFQHARRD